MNVTLRGHVLLQFVEDPVGEVTGTDEDEAQKKHTVLGCVITSESTQCKVALKTIRRQKEAWRGSCSMFMIVSKTATDARLMRL